MGAGIDRREQGGDPVRRVREVGVHGQDLFELMLQPVSESSHVGSPQALLAWARQYVQARLFEHPLAHQFAGTIRR